MRTEDQLQEFVNDVNKYGKEGQSFNRWLEDDVTLRVYVRRSIRIFGKGEMRRWTHMLDIASVEAEPKSQGRFTMFLEFVEKMRPFDGVLIENVQTIRFADFFRFRLGYKEIGYDLPSNFYKLWD